MLVKELKEILKESDDNKELFVYSFGNALVVQDLDTTITDRVDLIIDDEPITSRDSRIEELEQQNAFECECVKERDAKLKDIKKIVLGLSPNSVPNEVAVKLFEILCIIDK